MNRDWVSGSRLSVRSRDYGFLCVCIFICVHKQH
ncbi:unnamed protein product [Rhodiola kirilowii]